MQHRKDLADKMVSAVSGMTGEDYTSAEDALLDLGELMDVKPHAFMSEDVGGGNVRIEYAVPDCGAIVSLFDTSAALWANRAALERGEYPLMVQYINSDYGVLQ